MGVSCGEIYIKASTAIVNVGTKPAKSCCGGVTYVIHVP